MESRAAKLALARKKLKDHQERKQVTVQKVELLETLEAKNQEENNFYDENSDKEITVIEYQTVKTNGEDEENPDPQPITTNNYPQPIHTNNYPQPINTNLMNPLEMNVTEMLISSKRSLEAQVAELQSKLGDIDAKLKQEIFSHNNSKQRIIYLENELHDIDGKYSYAMEQMHQQNSQIEELSKTKSTLLDENNNLLEQLEFTKTILTAKETENASLHSQLDQLNRELEVSKLHLQQLLNGSNSYTLAGNSDPESNRNEELLQKVDNLEQQLKMAGKERHQINLHYEHYVGELNDQLKLAISKNEELSKQIYHLSNRESSLIDQISEMEIRLQNLHMKSLENNEKVLDKSVDITALKNDYRVVQEELQRVTMEYNKLQKQYEENEAKVMELQEIIKSSQDHDNISVTKLTADITSDKIAAQRATEQNKILKTQLRELEEAFVKMSQDKLQLTEKVTAEKFLNRELTLKLAECEDKCKDLLLKLKAKDDEMIRLQNNYRDLEKQYEDFSEKSKKHIENLSSGTKILLDQNNKEANESVDETVTLLDYENKHVHEPSCHASKEIEKTDLQKDDAMIKLQERFLKIMGEVADLSDEKHRLEHIILQLQNETDTICEYVALYQQQRSLLKKRDDERSAQIKLFQIECDRLKRELEELSGILIRFTEDKELAIYFEVEPRKNDIEKVRSLLFNLKSNTLVDPQKRDLELTKVFPCNCCSGNLIEV